MAKFQFKHGMVNTHEYGCWKAMKERICNPKPSDKILYVDRGIDIDPRWVESFQAFYNDIGAAPSSKHSIDRIDNNKGYWANNVRWATQKEQLRNCRMNHLITFQGNTLCLTDWALKTGLPISTIHNRVKAGWNIEKIFTTPSRKKNTASQYRCITYNGKTQTVTEWAEELGIARHLIYHRLDKGWDVEKTFATLPKVKQ